MFAEREADSVGRSTSFIYQWKDADKRSRNADIFTAKNVQTMCKIEHTLLAHKGKSAGPVGYEGRSADFTDFCTLVYTTANATEESTKCKGQSLTPAGAIYTALTGKAYSKDCVKLEDEEVQTAALCLFYFHYIGDQDKMKEAANVILRTCLCLSE